jgi:hypothetical protein
MDNTYTTCPNCGAKITCGCQRRTAIDGKTRACRKCVVSLNVKLKKTKKIPATRHYLKY